VEQTIALAPVACRLHQQTCSPASLPRRQVSPENLVALQPSRRNRLNCPPDQKITAHCFSPRPRFSLSFCVSTQPLPGQPQVSLRLTTAIRIPSSGPVSPRSGFSHGQPDLLALEAESCTRSTAAHSVHQVYPDDGLACHTCSRSFDYAIFNVLGYYQPSKAFTLPVWHCDQGLFPVF